jgi:hypothetical protein
MKTIAKSAIALASSAKELSTTGDDNMKKMSLKIQASQALLTSVNPSDQQRASEFLLSVLDS